MPDRGKGGFNRIAGADTLPMLRRKVEECHEFGPILLQAQRCLGVFGLKKLLAEQMLDNATL